MRNERTSDRMNRGAENEAGSAIWWMTGSTRGSTASTGQSTPTRRSSRRRSSASSRAAGSFSATKARWRGRATTGRPQIGRQPVYVMRQTDGSLGCLHQRLLPSGRGADPSQAVGTPTCSDLPFPRLGVRPRRPLHQASRTRRLGYAGDRTVARERFNLQPDRRPRLLQGVRVRKPEKRRAHAPGPSGGGGTLDRPAGRSGDGTAWRWCPGAPPT